MSSISINDSVAHQADTVNFVISLYNQTPLSIGFIAVAEDLKPVSGAVRGLAFSILCAFWVLLRSQGIALGKSVISWRLVTSVGPSQTLAPVNPMGSVSLIPFAGTSRPGPIFEPIDPMGQASLAWASRMAEGTLDSVAPNAPRPYFTS